MLRVGVLVSGSGTNLQSILDACERGDIDACVPVVISNIADAYALKRAQGRGIPAETVLYADYADRESFDLELVRILREHRIELVVLAGFMRILTPAFLNAFPGRIMNIHPSLLPSFPGLNVRQAAIDHGVRFSGCTVHFVDGNLDSGPIVIQAVVPVYPDDTEEELRQRILVQEHRIYPQAIGWFAQGRIIVDGRKVHIKDRVKEESSCLINPGLEN